MRLTRGTFLLTVITLFCVSWFYVPAVQAEKVVPSYLTAQNIELDGMENEDAWKKIKAVTTFDPIAQVEISIKSVYTATTIYFLASFPDKNESRLHRCWVWDNESEMYNEGPAREDVFVFKWKLDENTKDLSIYSDESYAADIWFWKAYRTDPVGFADDKIQRLFSFPTEGSFEVTSKSGAKMYIQRQGDAGRSSYKSEIFIDYEGDTVHRYKLRQPQLSRADISAKGAWSDGRWTVEFARPLVTGNIDDINFHSLDKSYGFGVSRYEIAGRPRENSDQPLYGSGDITEPLILEFQK